MIELLAGDNYSKFLVNKGYRRGKCEMDTKRHRRIIDGCNHVLQQDNKARYSFLMVGQPAQNLFTALDNSVDNTRYARSIG